jgi:VWFA-related protein
MKSAYCLLGVFIISLGLTLAQVSKESSPQNQTPIKVKVELVSVNVIVGDSAGRFIPGLTKDNFRVFEDNIQQQITHFAPIDQPFNVALALDTSGSMRERLWRIQEESISFVRMLHPDDEVAIVSFDDEVHLESRFSMDRDRIIRGIKSTRTGESTQVYEAVYLTLDQVLRPQQGRKAMVIFTDGVDTASRDTSQKETLRLAEESDGIIYPIKFNTRNDVLYGQRRPGVTVGPGGVQVPVPFPVPRSTRGIYGGGSGDIDRDYMVAAQYLKDLAERTGGRVVDADTIDDLGNAFAQVADDLRHQYSLAYTSNNAKHDGKLRKIKITVDQPGATVRARRGYYAPKS